MYNSLNITAQINNIHFGAPSTRIALVLKPDGSRDAAVTISDMAPLQT